MYCMYCMWVTWDKLEGKTGETLAWDSSYPGLKGSCKRNGASGHTGRCGRSAYVHPEWRILATVATGMGERYKKCGFYHLREVSILSSFPTLPLGCPSFDSVSHSTLVFTAREPHYQDPGFATLPERGPHIHSPFGSNQYNTVRLWQFLCACSHASTWF